MKFFKNCDTLMNISEVTRMFLKNNKERFMIVGLGNPGKQYEETRHNAGFLALDVLEEAFHAGPSNGKSSAEYRVAKQGDRELLFVRPMTFMNLSGKAVNEIGSFYKIPVDHIIVIADDVSLDVGRMRIRDKGSDGGHNGLKDILRVLGTQQLMRIKIGVGQKPHPDYDLADWVLGKFSAEDLKVLKDLYQGLPDCLDLLMNGELAKAQNRFNR